MSIGSYILAGGCVLALVGLITTLISIAPAGFAFASLPQVIIFSVLAMIAIGGALFLSLTKGDSPIVSVLIIGAVVLLAFAIFNLIDGKQDVLGTVMFSELERDFAPAVFACYWGVAGIIIFMLATLATSVSAFMGLSKE